MNRDMSTRIQNRNSDQCYWCKTLLLIAISSGLGGWLVFSSLACMRRSDRAPAVSLEGRFMILGQSYLPELGRAYAAAWNEGAGCLEAGQSLAASLQRVGKSWDAGRIQLFDRLITPELSKIVPEGQSGAQALCTQRLAMARAWRALAIGLETAAKRPR
jgi:hypothetical protein